jgi:hypothetical protein
VILKKIGFVITFSRERLLALAKEGRPLAEIIREATKDIINGVSVIEAQLFIDERQECFFSMPAALESQSIMS